MKTTVFVLFAGYVLAGCRAENRPIEAKPLDPLEFQAAKSDAERYLGPGAKVVALCGPSKGSILFVEKDGATIGPDEISGGVIALAFDASGKPDVVHRDALKEMIRVSENSGVVRFLPLPGSPPLGTWTIDFPSSGIVESHSLMSPKQGELVDVWTSTRASGFLPPRGSVFISKCKAA